MNLRVPEDLDRRLEKLAVEEHTSKSALLLQGAELGFAAPCSHPMCRAMASGRLGQESGARAGGGVKVWPEGRGLRPVHVFVVPREVLRQRLVTVSLSDCGRCLLGSPNQRRLTKELGGVIDNNLSDVLLVKLDFVFKTKVTTR